MKIDLYLSPCTKFKSNLVKDLDINPVTLDIIEEKLASSFEYTGTGYHFLNMIPITQTLIAIINKWHLLKVRSFCKAKNTFNNTK